MVNSPAERSYKKLTASPGPMGWIFGGFSLGLALAVVSGVAILSDRAHDALTIKSVSTRISSGNIREQDFHREISRQGTSFSSWVYEKIFGKEISEAPASLNHLLESFWGVRNGNMQSAWSNFEDAVKASDPLTRRKPEYGRKLYSLRNAFQAYNTSAEEHSRQQSEVDRLDALKKTVRKEYLATRDELIGLFGLEPAPFSEDKEPTFYGEGVLAGLPELPNIRDGIANFTILKDTIKGAGGSIAAFTENTNSQLQDTLGALSDTSNSIKETFEDTSESLSSLTEQLTSLATKEGSLKESLSQDIEDTIEFGVDSLKEFDLKELLDQ